MSRLLTETFDCVVVTPMFCVGASKEDVDVRPPSIRGKMRWWFRAMMGGIIGEGTNGLKKLKELESNVFGDTKTESKVEVRILERTLTFSDYPKLPHKNKGNSRAIDPASTFKIQLRATVNNKNDENTRQLLLDAAKYSFLLAANFDGFGSRSRRGFGSINVTNYTEELSALINEGKEKFMELAGRGTSPAFDGLTNYPCITNNHFTVLESSERESGFEALSELMEEMSRIKSRENFKNTLGGASGQIRQASPMIVHAIHGDNGKIKLRYVIFRTKLIDHFQVNKNNYQQLLENIKTKLKAKEIRIFQ